MTIEHNLLNQPIKVLLFTPKILVQTPAVLYFVPHLLESFIQYQWIHLQNILIFHQLPLSHQVQEFPMISLKECLYNSGSLIV